MKDSTSQPSRWRWWWPAVMVMIFIFLGSTDLGAMSHQSRFLGPFLRWLGLGEAAALGIILAIRKLAHLTEFAVLGVLVWRGWRQRPAFRPAVAWPWPAALIPLAICVGYALLDEFHQSFVPSRGASLGDVLIDSGGAAIGLALLWGWHRAQAAKPPA
jgi:VanZ family protein